MSLADRALSRAARLVGFPPGIGALVDRSARRKFLLSLLASLLLSALDMLGIVAMLPMMQYVAGQDPDSGALGAVSDLLGNPDEATLVLVLAGAVVGAFVVKDLVAVFVRRWQLHFMADQEVSMSTRMLQGYLVGPYHWHLVKNTSDKVWTVESAVQIGFSMGFSSALAGITELLTITLIVTALLFMSPVATLAALVYFGLAALVMQRVLRPRVLAASRRGVAAGRRTTRTSLQSLGAAKEIKLRQAHGRFVETYRRNRSIAAHSRATSGVLGELPKYVLEVLFVGGVGLFTVLTITTSGPGSGVVLLGVFVAAGVRILPSTVRLLSAVNNLRYAREPLRHLVHEYNRQAAARREEDAEVRTTEVPGGDLEVRDLSFSYPGHEHTLVLDGVDLTIRQGRSVALVGSSGAGKSTLVDLLLGLLRPTSGTITAGGLDIRANLPGWQRQVAVVPQDVYLLDDSLRTNIAFDEDVDPARLEDALARSQLTDLVSSLPEGVETVVGERGARLSGGQRQRIGIARALYRRPQVLVLDEATSALDNETERRLTETVESLRGQMTMIIVAHRLSTVRHCDELIFMSQGRVANRGTFEEVRRANDEFAHLVRLGSLDA